ncbi:MAG TPA: tRNA uridine-5-carboxymethylaminomethyl(34) synthesis GTPase MnmE [Acetobacteraceae bacterium]|nr:tRNA uridine-5-carboxymethylaminomethyl(34) synthesis GTPase MnmE [Acetobacteraceae bacterium]
MGTDTIFALASGAGRAAIAVFRLSGPATAGVLRTVCGRLPRPRVASLRALRDPDGVLLDRGIVVWMPGPHSYTGEDAAELHVHGGPAVLDGVAEALLRLGAEPAEPGAFTRRALLNGRMDVLEAEAVADLVAAETSAQRAQALRQLEGELGALYRGWTDRLTQVMARQEALIDFPDEDLPPEAEARLLREVETVRDEIAAHLADSRRGERLRDGLVFAVAGPPNVGKSTLVNALAGREVAITSPTPGTTRDALETRIVLAGVPVTLVDTAGIREAVDPVEAEGVRRARDRAAQADLVIRVFAPGIPDTGAEPGHAREIPVANKADLGGVLGTHALPVSAVTGIGLAALRARLEAAARNLTAQAGPPALTRARHRAALTEAAERLSGALETEWPELRAEDLRLALRAIGRVTGAVDVEQVLDALFAEFCIGK